MKNMIKYIVYFYFKFFSKQIMLKMFKRQKTILIKERIFLSQYFCLGLHEMFYRRSSYLATFIINIIITIITMIITMIITIIITIITTIIICIYIYEMCIAYYICIYIYCVFMCIHIHIICICVYVCVLSVISYNF